MIAGQRQIAGPDLAISRAARARLLRELSCFSALLSGVLLGYAPPSDAASRGAGVTCPQGAAYKDGCRGAPERNTIFPKLLDEYAVPPPWNVAGVHYPVGLSRPSARKDPRTAPLPLGCRLKGSTITCSGDIVLDGYDFSLHDGTTLLVTGGNVIVRDCLFVVGPNQGSYGRIVDVRGRSDASFIGNEFDGADVPVIPQRGQMINVINAGTISFKYNYFHNSGGDMIDFGGGPQVDVVQYNLFKDIGLKTGHSDTLQWCGSIVDNSDVSFNTVVQSKPGLSGMGLLTLNSECEGAKMSKMLAHNNTLISKVHDNFATGANVTQDAGPAVADHVAVFNNYVDPTGIEKFTASPWFPTAFYKWTLPRPTALHSLIDMRNGRSISPAIQPGPAAVKSSRYYVYPDATGYAPALSDVYSISASPSSGAVSKGETITFVLEMDEPWVVTGRPKLVLNSGEEAYYSGGTGTRELTFTYQVRVAERKADLAVVSVDLGDGTIKDSFGNDADLSGAVTTFVGLWVE